MTTGPLPEHTELTQLVTFIVLTASQVFEVVLVLPFTQIFVMAPFCPIEHDSVHVEPLACPEQLVSSTGAGVCGSVGTGVVFSKGTQLALPFVMPLRTSLLPHVIVMREVTSSQLKTTSLPTLFAVKSWLPAQAPTGEPQTRPLGDAITTWPTGQFFAGIVLHRTLLESLPFQDNTPAPLAAQRSIASGGKTVVAKAGEVARTEKRAVTAS